MAWWQKKLLRFALTHTGLLDEDALRLDDLDMTWGKKNVVDLKNVGLNIRRISKLAQLPPSVRVETARVLSLRLTVPADIHQSSVVAELNGVELEVVLDENHEKLGPTERKSSTRSRVGASSPQHRKVNRRLHSPSPHDPGGFLDDNDDEAYLPTTEELAKSFLLEEPAQERRELEASVTAGSGGLEESIVSESSEGDEYGVGVAMGLPSFLAGFLQGILDRLQVHVRDIVFRLKTSLSESEHDSIPLELVLRIGSASFSTSAVSATSVGVADNASTSKRRLDLKEITFGISSNADYLEELSIPPSRSSPAGSRKSTRTTSSSQLSAGNPQSELSQSHLSRSPPETIHSSGRLTQQPLFDEPQSSMTSQRSTYFGTASETHFADQGASVHSDLEIQPGDDNISWGSRRSQSSAPAENPWSSMESEDELPDSFLLERASTPRASSSGTGSPLLHRTSSLSQPRPMRQSPGSWPILEEENSHHRDARPESGSWPTIEHEPRTANQNYSVSFSGPTQNVPDNRTANLEDSVDRSTTADMFQSMASPSADLSESRLYNLEEVQSMYMSAMSHEANANMPGAWNSTGQTKLQESVSEATQSSLPDLSDDPVDDRDHSVESLDKPPSHPDDLASGNVTPRPPSPDPSPSREILADTTPTSSSQSIQLLQVDSMSILLPNGFSEIEQSQIASTEKSHASAPSVHRGMPGTFSEYSELAASRRRPLNASKELSYSTARMANDPAKALIQGNVEVIIGTVRLQLDFSSVRIGQRLVPSLVAALDQDKPKQDKLPKGDTDSPAFAVTIERIKLDLKHQIRLSSGPIDSDKALLAFESHNISVDKSSSECKACFGRLQASVRDIQTISFQKKAAIESSTTITSDAADVEIHIAMGDNPDQTPCTYIKLITLPVVLAIDMPSFEDTFESFGGLSALLEAGSSMVSDSGLASPPASPSKQSRGVRFTDEPASRLLRHEYKADATIGGLDITLLTESCSLALLTTKLKAVYREEGLSAATIGEILIQGPRLRNQAVAGLALRLTTLRLEYASAPQDKDLERLLALLTPSRDKYDSDDDILVETLLRQRKKGALARISVGGVKFDLETLDCLETISVMGNDLRRLSAVAKYLPEDDRPGVLTLIRIKEVEANVPVNDRFGQLQVGCSELHLAHVGIPFLLALSIDGVRASRAVDTIDLVRPLVPHNASDNLPMFMARMLGNEMEPTVKIKLFNVCAEYSVPTILALTNLDKELDAEQMMSELTKSVAGLGFSRQDSGSSTESPTSGSDPLKRTKIDLLVHDSAIGLSPQKLTSKALVVMTDVRFSTLAPPPNDTLTASIELRKAALYLADQVNPRGTTLTSVRGSPHNSATKAQLMMALYKQGFVSVGSMLAAKIKFQAKPNSDNSSKVVEVDVGSQLLLLETCADSTQTLIALLGQLAPPTPPSKQPKYLTEPMTIDDMMASFSGDAYMDTSQPPEKLFDAEEDMGDDPDMLLDMPGFDNADDGLLAESEMSSSLYGPVSGILSTADLPADDNGVLDDMTETVESLLEDDPFEMPMSPTDAKMSDAALMRDLRKQARPASSNDTVDLDICEIEDLGFDALNGAQYVLGTQNRFNTPATTARKRPNAKTGVQLPFQLRLRDVHIIWNIYDGYDWQRTREGITQAVEQVEQKAEERKARQRQRINDRDDDESVIGDFLFNSIYIGVPSNLDAQEIRRQINRGIDDQATETESAPFSGMSRPTAYSASAHPAGQDRRRRLKLERSRTHKVAFELKGLSADVMVFPPESADVVGCIDIRVRDFEIFDNVPTSTWRKFLTHLSDGPDGREMSKPMMHIEVLNLRTLENYSASELALHVSVLPLRLHVDQDALDFITRFFEFKDTATKTSEPAGEQPFLQRIEIDTVDLCLDYKPKKLDYAGLRSGHTTEFMNIVILDAANIRLRHAIVYGIKGFEPLHKTLNDVWMPDIKRNQLMTVLAGLAPARSLVNIATGVRDIVAIPIQEYRKDGRLVRSIQKGAFHFGRTTTAELARLGAKVAMGTQTLLQGAEGLLSPQSPSALARPDIGRRVSSEQGWYDTETDEETKEQRAISAYADQPLGVLSGLRSARRYLERDLLTAKDALIAVQGEVLQSTGPANAAAAVARHAPTVIIRPVTGVSRAVGTALLGVSNQIDRSNVSRVADKYKKR